ncbi:MAG: transposase [Bacteroidales bacterium]|nr:transposase [Bacteroidales bacterium]
MKDLYLIGNHGFPEGGNSSTIEFYLVTTDHLSEAIWFKDDQDYKVCISYIAILSLISGVKVLAFILMSNHLHLVLQCTEPEARWFIDELKRRYSEYLNRRYGTDDFLRRNHCDIRRVYIDDESLERAIAYTIMNCVAANICLNATDYPWSSARAYFRLDKPSGVRFGDMSKRSRRKTLHSKAIIPDEIIISEGHIALESFVSVSFVESLFRTPKRLNYFMLNSSKAKRVLASKDVRIPSFKDQVILAAVPDLCRSLFRKNSPADLNTEELKEIIIQIRHRFSADVNQIARVLGIPYSNIASSLDSF